MNILRRYKALFNPEWFQGWGREKKYFEGWYFKMVGPKRDLALAVIPGIAFDESGDGHAFIQVLDGIKGTSTYHKFSASDFEAAADRLEVSIGFNHFSDRGLEVDLKELKAAIRFSDTVGWPKSMLSPGIMGPYSFAPFMECYHGIVSMDHTLEGVITLDGISHDVSGGRGYIEKDWGRSFPRAYVWMQSNHFGHSRTSLKASVARIPWLTGDFNGFIAGLWHEGKLYQFTTYNRSRLVKHEVTHQRVTIEMINPRYRLGVLGLRDRSTELASPILGAMSGKIEETMLAELHVELVDRKDGATLFKGVGMSAGLEVAGDIDLITTS